jgi:predicted RNA binding protein YcfA (HicA-like mRNA interferase family)
MPKIPLLTAKQIIRALRKAGFVEDRQKGSHLVMLHLYSIISDAKLSPDDFLKLL